MFVAAVVYQAGLNEESWIWVLVSGFLVELFEL